MGRSDGLTKLIVDPETHRILGAGIVGVNAGELLAEAVLAIEAGLDAEDVALTIHPHPTLSETDRLLRRAGRGDDHGHHAQAQARCAVDVEETIVYSYAPHGA